MCLRIVRLPLASRDVANTGRNRTSALQRLMSSVLEGARLGQSAIQGEPRRGPGNEDAALTLGDRCGAALSSGLRSVRLLLFIRMKNRFGLRICGVKDFDV